MPNIQAERINITDRDYVWAVDYGNFYKPDGRVYVDCVGKITACLVAADLGHPRTYTCHIVPRSEVPPNTVIHKRKEQSHV
jgi:hypothetical protein